MPKRDLHDGRDDGLRPLESLDLSSIGSFAELVRAMGNTAFGGRALGRALDVLLEMVHDPECRMILTLSGAMTVAKQGRIVCEMIDRGLVDAVVATGALMAHGLSESIGLAHYAVEPGISDTELFEKGYNRVYDTLEMEANLNDVEQVVSTALDRYPPEDGVWSSARFCRAVGRRLEELDQGPGILRSAWKRDVPVFIPAFTDSEIGLDVCVWAMRQALTARRRTDEPAILKQAFQTVPSFNPFLDLQEYALLADSSDHLGIFTIGGGVPRNWAQQVAPYYDISMYRLQIEGTAPRFRYGVRICPEPAHWGGLSGCTYQEGVSWGKFLAPEQGGRFAEVHADATTVWPLLMKALFEVLDGETAR